MKSLFRNLMLTPVERCEQKLAAIRDGQLLLTAQFADGTAPDDVVEQMTRLEVEEKLARAALKKAQDDAAAAADAEAAQRRKDDAEREAAQRKSAHAAIIKHTQRVEKSGAEIEAAAGALVDAIVTRCDALDKIDALLPEGIPFGATIETGERLAPLLQGYSSRQFSRGVLIGRELARAGHRRNVLEHVPGADADGIDLDQIPTLSHTDKQVTAALRAISKEQLLGPPKPPPQPSVASFMPKAYRPARFEPILTAPPPYSGSHLRRRDGESELELRDRQRGIVGWTYHLESGDPEVPYRGIPRWVTPEQRPDLWARLQIEHPEAGVAPGANAPPDPEPIHAEPVQEIAPSEAEPIRAEPLPVVDDLPIDPYEEMRQHSKALQWQEPSPTSEEY